MKVTAIAERSGSWWAVRVLEVKGVYTQAKRIEHIADMAADATALMLDVDPRDIEVTVEVHTSEDSLVVAAKEAKDEAKRAADVASTRMREAARALVAEGLPVRDAGKVLGVSSQRISQLVASGQS